MTTEYRFADETISCPLQLSLPTSSSRPVANIELSLNSTTNVRPEFSSYISRGVMNGEEWALGTVAGEPGWAFITGQASVGHISADGSMIALNVVNEALEPWIAELITAWVLTYRLVVLDRWTFHGSAVEIPGWGSVAFLGAMGAGKSTVAAALCATGATLIADDLLTGTVSNREIRLQQTSSTLKLRDGARHLGHRIPGGLLSETFDHRLGVEMSAELHGLPLRRVMFIVREPSKVGLRQLRPVEVTTRLLAESKIFTWQDPKYREIEFDAACDIAARVPGFELSPAHWNDETTADELADFVRQTVL